MSIGRLYHIYYTFVIILISSYINSIQSVLRVLMLTTFLAHFNTIDKQLDDIVQSDKFLPYNEKINKIAHGHYAISPWVRHHSDQLKYLGEIRNLLIHHQGEDHNYVQITQEAIDDIVTLSKFLATPPSMTDYMSSPVVTCAPSDHVRDVLQAHQTRFGHILVIDG